MDANDDIVVQVSVHFAKRQTQGFQAVVDSDPYKQAGHSAGSQELGLRFFPIYRVHEKRLSANDSNYKSWALVDHEAFISADKFLLRVHIKRVFLLWVHRTPIDNIQGISEDKESLDVNPEKEFIC